MRTPYSGKPDLVHEFFTPTQIKRAQRWRRRKFTSVKGEQLRFSWEVEGLRKTDHIRRLKVELTKGAKL